MDTIHFIREEKLAPNVDIQILKLENIDGLKDIPDKDNGNTLLLKTISYFNWIVILNIYDRLSIIHRIDLIRDYLSFDNQPVFYDQEE